MLRVGIVGATGLVGQKIVDCLFEEGLFDKIELSLFASEKNYGKCIMLHSVEFRVLKLSEDALKKNFDIVFFSAGEEVSRLWAEKFAEKGAFVIDNSNAFRRKEGVPLVCPEINATLINEGTKIIANPNCSTIQLALVLSAMLKYKIKKVVVSTYQSVSGAGKEALSDLENRTNLSIKEGITDNVIAKIGEILENGFCVEEDKIMLETSKILGENIDVSATTVRVPIPFCHTESVYVEFENDISPGEIAKDLKNFGIIVDGEVTLPSEVTNTNGVHVTRLRKHGKRELMFVVVADNLRRGAAYNAVAISAFIIKNILKKC